MSTPNLASAMDLKEFIFLYDQALEWASSKDGCDCIYEEKKLSKKLVENLLNLIFEKIVGQESIWSDYKILSSGKVLDIKNRNETVNIFDVSHLLFDNNTVVLHFLESFFPVFASLFLKATCSHNIYSHANLYWTPQNSWGPGKHSDDHDVVVVQLYGQKVWNVWTDGKLVSLELSSGDTLMLRSGIQHNPICLSSSSIHITIGLNQLKDEMRKGNAIKLYKDSINNSTSSELSRDWKSKIPDILDVIEPSKMHRVFWSDRLEIDYLDNKAVIKKSDNYCFECDLSLLTSMFKDDPGAGRRVIFHEKINKQSAFELMVGMMISGLIEF